MKRRFCCMRYPASTRNTDGTMGARAMLDRELAWRAGDTVTYWFYDEPRRWTAPKKQMEIVRKAFGVWEAVGMNLSFDEVTDRRKADLRIGFDRAEDSSWSVVGTDCRSVKRGPTMNFGWNLVGDFDTALHEIGHALGLPHEHQNPKAGIVWDEEAVLESFAGDPNYWSEDETRENVLDKVELESVKGSRWDPNSIMHYAFEKGLIRKPPRYRKGLKPKGGLSARDRKLVRSFYPS